MSGPSLRRTIRLGYAVVAVLALGAGALGVLNWRKHQAGGQAPAEDAVTVAVTDRACEPDSLTVPAGRVAFRILNRSQRMLEWEILDGVMVVEERENIAPGLSQRLVARLAPGEYAITCGLLGNPRGRLVVAPGKDGAPAAPDLRELVGPMAEYKVYLTLEGAMLAEAAARLADTVSAGRDAAEALAAAHAAYQHLRPAGRVMQADLDTALDARAADFARGAADPAFTGFRRLSLALGHEDAPALAARLQADVTLLLARLDDTMVPPDRMLAGAALMAREAAETPDSALAVAMLDGVARIVQLLGPPGRRLDGVGAARLEAALATARQTFSARDQVTRRAALVALAEAIAALRDTLGLS
jgi:iron uptake system component EfeO